MSRRRPAPDPHYVPIPIEVGWILVLFNVSIAVAFMVASCSELW